MGRDLVFDLIDTRVQRSSDPVWGILNYIAMHKRRRKLNGSGFAATFEWLELSWGELSWGGAKKSARPYIRGGRCAQASLAGQ
jgi:hypothetical protein